MKLALNQQYYKKKKKKTDPLASPEQECEIGLAMKNVNSAKRVTYKKMSHIEKKRKIVAPTISQYMKSIDNRMQGVVW